MRAPVKIELWLALIEGHQDERGAPEVVGGADDLGRRPAMLVHDLRRVVDVLDGVLRLRLFQDIGGRDSLAGRELGHRVGLDEVIVCRSAGHDDVVRDACFVLSHAFQNPLPLFGRWRAVEAGRRAKDNDGVEVRLLGIVAWDDDEVSIHHQQKDPHCQEEGEERLPKESHAINVADVSGRLVSRIL